MNGGDADGCTDGHSKFLTVKHNTLATFCGRA